MKRIYNSIFLDCVLIAISLYTLYFIFHKFSVGKIPFWDFHVHYCSAKNYLLGNFPYGIDALKSCLDPNITLTANYSPGTLELIKYLGYFNIQNANILWVFFEIISLLSLFFILKEIFKFDYEWRNILIFFFSFGGTIFISFISGNLSVILYGLISLGIYFLYKNLFNLYYLIILFVSLFKFYYLSFLIIPFYLIGLKSLNKIFVSILLFVIIQYFFYINNPNLSMAFFDVIQGKYTDVLPVRMLTGSGLYSLIEKIPWALQGVTDFDKSFFSLETNLMIWLIVSFVILLSIFYFLNGEKIKKSNNHFLFCLSFGILSIDLIIPRLVVYDLILTVPIIFYLLNQINFKRLIKTNFDLKNIFFLIFFVLFDHHFPFLMVISFLTLFLYSEHYKKNIFVY